MNAKIVRILELIIIKDNGAVEFPQGSKELIHDVAEECRNLYLYKKGKEKEETYKKGLTAEQAYIDMCFKITNAPTSFHMMAVPRMMLPVIDDLLQEKNQEK